MEGGWRGVGERGGALAGCASARTPGTRPPHPHTHTPRSPRGHAGTFPGCGAERRGGWRMGGWTDGKAEKGGTGNSGCLSPPSPRFSPLCTGDMRGARGRERGSPEGVWRVCCSNRRARAAPSRGGAVGARTGAAQTTRHLQRPPSAPAGGPADCIWVRGGVERERGRRRGRILLLAAALLGAV